VALFMSQDGFSLSQEHFETLKGTYG